MIGAQSMESAILGHYVEYVRGLHPDAPLPGVFKAEGSSQMLIACASRCVTKGFFVSSTRS